MTTANSGSVSEVSSLVPDDDELVTADKRKHSATADERRSTRASFVVDGQGRRRRRSTTVTAAPGTVRRGSRAAGRAHHHSVDRVDLNVGGVPLSITDKTNPGLTVHSLHRHQLHGTICLHIFVVVPLCHSFYLNSSLTFSWPLSLLSNTHVVYSPLTQ